QPDSDYLIEFFASTAADPSGFGEGQTWYSANDIMVHTDPTGLATFTVDLPLISGMLVLTSTATFVGSPSQGPTFSAFNNSVPPSAFLETSEFSRNLTVTIPTNPTTPTETTLTSDTTIINSLEHPAKQAGPPGLPPEPPTLQRIRRLVPEPERLPDFELL